MNTVSDAPEPAPTALTWVTTSRTTSAITQVPIAK
jgi:hypothetical protein